MAQLLLGGAAAAAGAAALPAWAAGAGFTALAAPAATAGLSTVLTVLSGVATAASIFGSLSSASADALQANQNAVQAEVDAGQSQVEATQQQTSLKRELAKALGENDVAIAASGIDLQGGIARSSRAAAVSDTQTQLSLSRADDDMRRALLKARAQGYRAQASSYETAGLLKAVGYAADFGMGVLQRG